MRYSRAMPAQRTATAHPPRAAEESRERLLRAGLRLFALQGFSKTSTRELAEAADVNVAAISYYFGDKAGLYRAVFFEPMGGAPAADPARIADRSLPLAQALAAFYESFVEPLKQGDTARLCMKLHFRELLEPTGLWNEELAHGIKPLHEALVTVLGRHFGLARSDDDLLRLATSLAGLGVHLHVARDVIDELAPGLTAGPEAFDVWRDRLVMYALAMIEAERRRRAAPAEGAPA